MNYKLWVYKADGYVTAIVEDTNTIVKQVKLRDQSIYPEDGGKLVWKNASHPASVMNAVKLGKGFILAESNSLAALDANIKQSTLSYLWEARNAQ